MNHSYSSWLARPLRRWAHHFAGALGQAQASAGSNPPKHAPAFAKSPFGPSASTYLIALLSLLLGWLPAASSVAQCLPAWAYQAPLTVTNPSATALSDFQVKVTLNTAALIAAGKLQASGNDLRFVDASCTQLSYWIESGLNTATTVVWVKVPVITGSNTTTLALYYGNAAAPAASSGENTFLLFDNFDGTSLNTTKWAAYGTAPVVSNGAIQFTSSNGSSIIRSVAAYSAPVIAEANVNAASGNWPNIAQLASGTFNGYSLFLGGSTMYLTNTVVLGNSYAGAGNYGLASAAAGTVAGIWGVSWVNAQQKGTWPSGTLNFTGSNPAYPSAVQLAVGGLETGNGSMNVDWYRARKYAAAEPSTAIGAEQSTPTLASINPTSAMAGTSVTLTGSNLSGATAVTFAGTSNNTVTTGLTVSGSGSSQTITVTVPTGANTGNVTVTTPGGTSNGVAFTVTPVAAPVVVLPANNSTTNSSPIFQVTATPGSYVSVYLNGTSPGQYLTPSTGIVQAQYSGLADGVYTLYATATAQRSGAPVSAPSNTVTFTVDGTAPTATISTTSASPTTTAPIPFTVSFSEPVTGLSASSFTVSNGTVTSGPTSSGGNTYSFSVTPTGNGTVTVSLPANAVRDAVGNGNTASNSLSVQYTAPVASGLSVQYQTGDLGQPNDNQLRPFLQLVNSGTTAVPYSSLTIRYWLTVEDFKGQLVTPIDYAKLGTSFVSARYVQLATPRQGAFGYIEYAFAAGAGNLAAGTNSGPIYGKAYKPDYTNFNETDDWSYQTSSSFTTNDHVTLYQNGTLIGGTEPTAVTSTTSIRVFAGNQDTSPSTSYINVTLQVGNVGNRPVNYADLTVRYYFTRDGAMTIVPQVDYAKLGANNISVRYVPLATPLNGADGYLEIGFSSALGVFYPSTNTDNIQFKIRKGDYTAFTQTNDYSFSSSSAVVAQPRVPAYLNGVLVYGTEPSTAIATTARSSQETSARSGTADADAAATSAPLALALTASPNPFGEQLTLRFALPTTQAYTLAVYDGQGRLVQQVASGQAEAAQAQELAVPTQGYAAGLYLVRLTTASSVQTLKLIKR